MLAHLLRDALRHAHQAPRPVEREAHPLREPPEQVCDARVGAEQQVRAAGVRRAHLMAVVNRDHVDATEHDRPRRLHEPPVTARRSASEAASMNHGWLSSSGRPGPGTRTHLTPAPGGSSHA